MKQLMDQLRRVARSRRLVVVGLAAGLGCLVAVWVAARLVPLPKRLAQPPSTQVFFSDGSPAFVFLSPDDRYRMEVRPEDLEAFFEGAETGEEAFESAGRIDPEYLGALLRFEDKRFLRHWGVDGLAVLRSAWLNFRHRRVVSGASTVTLQLVRVLEPRPRTLRSKVVEALRAVQLEARFSKREILALYLTYVPFGRNLEGIRAASWAYFGHSPASLSGSEIATLLAVPQRPASRYPSASNRARLVSARDEIAAWLLERGFDLEPGVPGDVQDQLAVVRAGTVPLEIRPLPRAAPHLAFWLREHWPDERRLMTTLDRGLQGLAEQRLAAEAAELQALGIHNGSVVLVDHRDAEVRALVGNVDFWDHLHGGQIPGFSVARSPGSTLKPFLYGAAVDAGLALPEQLVADIPVEYGDYSPRNFDRDHTGLISLEDALSHSLNIPFVQLLQRVGIDAFLDLLRRGGVNSLIEESGYYGLSAAIGALELTPLEVAELYAALARDGEVKPLRLLVEPRDAERDESTERTERRASRILSPGASFLVKRALSRRDRPDFPERRRFSGAPRAIHWKTGTSFGHRDAWAVGSHESLTVVVWLGNFDQEPATDLVGAEAAGPILFDVLEAAQERRGYALPDRLPRDLKFVDVCAYSGHLAGEACPLERRVLGLRSRIPSKPCPYHRNITVDLDSGLRLNPSCRADRRYETRSALVWPAHVQRFYAQEGRFFPRLPELHPSCRATTSRERLAIVSPPLGQSLVLIPGVRADRQEVPLRAAANVSERLSWFVDGRYVGTADASGELWWTPEPGRHEIRVESEGGAWAERELVVREGTGGVTASG